jgi:general secretion pathway protein I
LFRKSCSSAPVSPKCVSEDAAAIHEPRTRGLGGTAGFTLIEALVALAIVAVVLGSIGSVIATTVKGTRSIDQRLALTGTAETLLAALPGRLMLKPGRQSGETAGHRWRVDVSPLKMAAESDAPQTGRFVPLAVSMQVQAPGGPLMQITTVRLVPRGAE